MTKLSSRSRATRQTSISPLPVFPLSLFITQLSSRSQHLIEIPCSLRTPNTMITLRLIAIGLTGVSAFMLTGRQDSNSSKNAYEDVCLPTNAAGLPDFSAPCNLRSRTERLCVFGEQIRGIVDSSGLDNYGEKDGHPMSHQLYRNQRDCICQSQLFDQMEGCRACFYAVVGDARYLYASSAIKSFSSTYCAVTAMPQAYYVAMDSVLEALDEKTDPPTSVSSPPNPFGSKTDVSFYWTPSATGVSAWDVRLPTRAHSYILKFAHLGGTNHSYRGCRRLRHRRQ